MAYTLEEFAKLSDEDLKRKFPHLFNMNLCSVCGEKPAVSSEELRRRKDEKGRIELICKDCFYKEIGKKIYEHPIGAPRYGLHMPD